MNKYARDIKAIRAVAPEKALLTCHDEYLLASMVQGIDGALVGFASLVPGLINDLLEAVKAGDLQRGHGDPGAHRSVEGCGVRRRRADRRGAWPHEGGDGRPSGSCPTDGCGRRHTRRRRGNRGDQRGDQGRRAVAKPRRERSTQRIAGSLGAREETLMSLQPNIASDGQRASRSERSSGSRNVSKTYVTASSGNVHA